MNQDNQKKLAAKTALQFIKPDMTIGLGSGSTAEYFISYLIKEVKNGLNIVAVSSSERSAKIARTGGILVKDIDDVDRIDLTIDGADEIDFEKRMIKGGGGAHVREKILALASNEMIVIIDKTKLVKKLGSSKLPVEVLRYGHTHVRKTLGKYSFPSTFRKNNNNSFFVTDNRNYILDVDISKSNEALENINHIISSIPGVVETGFFFKIAKKVIIGIDENTTEILT